MDEKVYRFGEFELRPGQGLFKGAQRTSLQPQAWPLLQYLIENCDRYVSRNDLLEKVWNVKFPQQRNNQVSNQIRGIKNVLGDSAIEFAKKAGYRFALDVVGEKRDREKQKRLLRLKYRANEHFVGRDADLTLLHEELYGITRDGLTIGRVRAVTGMGGIGKTTLARQYAEKYWPVYSQIFWIDAREGLEAEFAAIHDVIFPERVTFALDRGDKARRALHELHDHESRLLIIDNALDEDSITAWIPSHGGCHTLITSRFSGFSESISTVPLDVINQNAAVEFLQRRTGRNVEGLELGACAKLAEKLGNLPLALEQAAAYINKQKLQFSEYLVVYENARRALLALRALGSTNYPDSVITSLHPSVERLPTGARVFLSMASILANTPIPLEMFAAEPTAILNRVGAFGAPVFGQADYQIWLRDQIGNLLDYSLGSFDGRRYRLHPLLHVVEYETQSDEERREYWCAAVEIAIAWAPASSWKIDVRDQWSSDGDRIWNELLPHVDRLLLLQNQVAGLPASPRLQLLAVNAFASGMDYLRALDVCERLVVGLTEDGADSSELLIDARECLAALLKQSDKYERALVEFRLLHNLCVEELGEDHRRTLRALHNVACLRELLGDSDDAERIMRNLLSRRQSIFGDKDYDTVISLHDLAWLLDRNEEKRDEAGPLFQRAIDVWTETFGVSAPDTRDAMKNYASHLRNKGDYKIALEIQRGLLEAVRAVFGDQHYNCFDTMHNVALFEQLTGDYERSHTTIAAVVTGYRRYLPPDHRDMLTALQDLGTILGLLGRYEDAEPLLKEALAGYERTQGLATRDTLRTLRNLAGVLDRLARHEEAATLSRRLILAVISKQNPEISELAIAASESLSIGAIEQSKELLSKLATRLAHVEPGGLSRNPEVLTALNNCGFELRKAGRLSEAEPIDRMTVSASVIGLGPHAALTLHRRNNLVQTLIMMGKFSEARQELEINREVQSEPPTNVTARIVFLRWLLAALSCEATELFLGQLKTLIVGPALASAAGVARFWDIKYFLDYLRLSPEVEKAAVLIVTALNDSERNNELSGVAGWIAIAPNLKADIVQRLATNVAV